MERGGRWRLISAALAVACIFLALLLWTVNARLHATERQMLHALDGCPPSCGDLEHS